MTDEQGAPLPEPIEPPLAVPPAPPKEMPKSDGVRTNPINWLFCLFFRPGKFFEEYAKATPAWLVVICTGIFGAAWGIWKNVPEEDRAKLPQMGALGYVLGTTLGYAVIGGLFWYFFAGTWYALRISFCKPEGMTRKLARRAFMFSELIYALPTATMTAIWWIVEGRSFLILTIVVTAICICWSVYVSYRGARTLFKATPIRAALLFLVLPYLFYGVAFAPAFLLGNVKSHLTQVEVPFENSVFTMHRPANWLELKAPSLTAVTFHIPNVGSFAAVVGDPQGQAVDLERTTQISAQNMAAKLSTTANPLDTFPTWGTYSGHGMRSSIKGNGKDIIIRVFCGTLPDGRFLLVNEFCQADAEAQLQPQFEIARRTLQVKPARQGSGVSAGANQEGQKTTEKGKP